MMTMKVWESGTLFLGKCDYVDIVENIHSLYVYELINALIIMVAFKM